MSNTTTTTKTLTDEYPWGVIDTTTGKIVSRSSEGYLAADKARALNRKDGTGRLEPTSDYDGNGNRIWRKNLSDRYDITNQQPTP